MKIDIAEELVKLVGGAPRRDHDRAISDYRTGKDYLGRPFERPYEASQRANELATALLEVIAAKAELVNEENSDSYGSRDTGPQTDAYQRAVERLWNAVGGR